MPVQSLHERIAVGRRALVDAGFRPEDAALDAEVLARHVLGWDLARLIAHIRDAQPPSFSGAFDELIARRVRREPVAMIVGHREFWGLEFLVSPATLIPRPETELIVEEGLRLLPAEYPSIVLDIGTGTGCLAVSLAYERRDATVVATDISHEALLVARHNARIHGVSDRIRWVRTDLAGGLSLRADLIVSNPPYVPDSASSILAPEVGRYEPATALFGGADGLSVIRRLFAAVPRHIAAGGTFVVEFGFGQEDDVRAAAGQEGWRVERVLHDLQGIARTIVVRR